MGRRVSGAVQPSHHRRKRFKVLARYDDVREAEALATSLKIVDDLVDGPSEHIRRCEHFGGWRTEAGSDRGCNGSPIGRHCDQEYENIQLQLVKAVTGCLA